MKGYGSYDEEPWVSDIDGYYEDNEDARHKARMRKKLEKHLEMKRLKEECGSDLDGDLDWDKFDDF